MFIGEFNQKLDAKNRTTIPVKLRESLGNSFIITRGLDKCLFVYPENEWITIVAKLKNIPFTKKNARTFMRYFLSGAVNVELDNNGRVIIPKNLQEYSDLNKDVVFVGVNERIEIWDKQIWENFLSENEEDFTNIAEELLNGEFEL